MIERARPLALLAALVCPVAVGCADVFDIENVTPAPGPTGAYAKTITIAQPTATMLEDFPLALFLAEDAELAAHALDGTDIGFEADGVSLPCEIVRYDGALGLLEAWVRVPVVPAGPAVTELDLVYGAPRTPCSAVGMWGPPHVAVWHSTLDTDRTRDATSHGHDLVAATEEALPVEREGILGAGLQFDGVDDLLCDAVDEDGSLAFDETESFSYSAWVHVTAPAGAYDMPFYKGGGSQGNPGFQLALGTGDWNAALSDGAHLEGLRVLFGNDPLLGAWHHLVTVIDRDANVATSYVDGSAREAEPLGGWGSFVADARTCMSNVANLFAGASDELRVTAATRSAAWIEVEYINLARPADLISLGTERALTGD